MNDLRTAWLRITSLKRWVLIAAVVGFVLAIYYLMLGVRYYNAANEEAALKDEILTVTRALQRRIPDEAPVLERLADQELLVQTAGEPFTPLDTAAVIELLSRSASSAGVTMATINLSNIVPTAEQDVTFDTRTAEIVLSGSTDEIFAFLQAIRDAAPGVRVDDLDFSNLLSEPTAKTRLTFFMLPDELAENPVG
ncbi:MAG: hypothetical protein IIC82_03275 [Chloroflexi bacterium]|nr:hypothetical protein [Chloroflexota bacterium]